MDSVTPETLEQLRTENRQLRAENQQLRAHIATLEAHDDPAPLILGLAPYGQPIWFDAVSEAVFVTDAERQIQHWNRAAEQIYGWPRAEALGRPITAIIPPARYLDDDVAIAMQRLRQEGLWRGMVLQRARDGRELVIESATQALYDDQGALRGYIGVNRDVTARVAAQQALQRAAERLQVLADASRAFAEVGTAYQAVLDRVAQAAATGLNAECMIYLRSPDGAWLDLAAVYDRDPEKVALTRLTVSSDPLHVDEPSFATRILHTGQPLFFPVVDPEQMRAVAKPAYQPSLDRLQVRSIIGVPMRAQGQTIGVLVLFRHQPAQALFDQDDLTLAQDLADRAALAITNARLYQEAQLASRASAEAHAQLDALVRSVPNGIGSFDTALRFQLVNPALAALNGRPAAEHLGRTLAEVIPNLAPQVEPLMRQVLASGVAVYDIEIHGVTAAAPDEPRIWLASYAPVSMRDGTVIGVSAVVVEITERLHAQAALQQQADTLRERETDLRLAYDAAQIGTWRRDLAAGSRSVQLDARAQIHYGVTSADLALDDLLARIHPDDRPQVARVITALPEAGGDARAMIEYRLTHPDGTLHWLAVHISVFAAGEGANRRAVLATGVVQDITARKQVEAEIHYQANLLRFVHDAVIATDLTFQITSWNHAAETLYGWSAAEVVGRQTTAVLQTAYPDGDEAQALRQLQAAGAWKGEVIQHDRDGRAITIMASVVAMYTPAGEALGFVAVNRDITDRKQAEAQARLALAAERVARQAAEAAAERTSRLQAITADLAGALTRDQVIAVMTGHGCVATAAANVIVALLDSDTQQLVCVGWSGRSAEELAAVSPVPLSAPQPLSAVVRDRVPVWLVSCDAAEICFPGVGAIMARDGKQAQATLPLINADRIVGAICFCYTAPTVFADEDQAFLHVLAQQCAQSLERVRLYGEVLAAHVRLQHLGERLIAVQEEERRHLARELHDEIGQSLTGLSLLLSTGRALPSEALYVQLDAAQRQVTRLIAQVRQRSMDLRPSMLDDLGLHPALVWYLTHYREQTRIRLDVELQEIARRFPPLVELTAYRIVQEALTNVARHAGVTEATVLVWVVDAQLMIEVSDQGQGFDHETVRQRYASTGLVGMRERVALLGGELTIETAPGSGTRLFAALPCTRPAATTEEAR